MVLEPKVNELQDAMLKMTSTVISLSNEMSEFKDKMSQDTKEFKDQMRQDTKEFKDKMSQDTKEFKDDLNKKWGELSNQLGRVVENLILPNIDLLIERHFKEQIEEHMAKIYKKSISGDRKEFDGIVVTPSYVFLFEVKNQVRKEYVDEFQRFIQANEFNNYFPHYKDKKLIPVMGSLYLKPHQVKFLTDANILAMSIYGDILEFKNIDDINL